MTRSPRPAQARNSKVGAPARGVPLIELDYIYTPSTDVAADLKYFTDVLGATLEFSIEAMGARVAMVQLAGGPPHVILTDHLQGERPILIYRVADLDGTLADLKERGWKQEAILEIPLGPCCSFTTPGGHRFAVYQLTRPGAVAHFQGRRDF